MDKETDYVWAKRRIARLMDDRRRAACCGAPDRVTAAWISVRNHELVVVEVRGTMSYQPHHLINRRLNK